MAESLGSHAILALIELWRIINLSVRKGGAHAKFGGNVTVDFPDVGSFRIEFGLAL